MNVLCALLFVLALVLLVTGFMLLRFARRARSIRGAVLAEAKVIEIARYVPLDKDAGDRKEKTEKREQFCPIFEMTHENKIMQFRGAPAPGKPQWIAGETTRLLYSPEEGTAVEWEKVRVSLWIGRAFTILGLCIAAAALILKLSDILF